MKKLKNSAAYRIAFAYSAAIAIGIALLGAVIFWAMHVAFTRQIDAMVTDEAQTLLYEYRPNEPSELADSIAQRERFGRGARLYYAVFEPDGRRAMGSLNAAMPELGMHDIPFVDPIGRDRRGTGTGHRASRPSPARRRRRSRVDRADRPHRSRHFRRRVCRPDRPRDWRSVAARRLFAAATEGDRQRGRRHHRRRYPRAGCQSAIETTNSTSWPGC